MKYTLIFLALLSFLIVSCSKSSEEETSANANCDCDRVMSKTTFNVLGTPQNPSVTYHTTYITINDCSQVQKTKTHNTTNVDLIPKIGECR